MSYAENQVELILNQSKISYYFFSERYRHQLLNVKMTDHNYK